ncbi:MAG: fructosamine kinase family protein [Sphingomonadales bacterium]
MNERLANALGVSVEAIKRLSGGSIADVSAAKLGDGRTVVVKQPRAGAMLSTLTVEAMMLRYLAEHSSLPVPEVLHVEDDVLVLSFIPHSGGLTATGERAAGRAIAALHDVTADKYGFDVSTVIGPLLQANDRNDDWMAFFRDQRLLDMGRACLDAGRIDTGDFMRLERLAGKLGALIPRRPAACLLHGDLWGGNILGDGDRVAGFVDPAIYYGDPEMDLAFATLFGSVGSAFFVGYQEIRSINKGFFDSRRELYHLWPLLVHVRLFGGGYWGQVEAILSRHGC